VWNIWISEARAGIQMGANVNGHCRDVFADLVEPRSRT